VGVGGASRPGHHRRRAPCTVDPATSVWDRAMHTGLAESIVAVDHKMEGSFLNQSGMLCGPPDKKHVA
jgi:hypothetical protein